MGSDKKKKDKKKDKKKKNRHSDSPDRREKKRHKHDSPSSNADNFEQASLSVDDTNKLREKLGLKPLQVEPKKEEKEEEDKNVISLSIEETNKLREKLGLKPLDVDNKSGDVHAPAKNIRKILETEKLAEKMKMLKEKRRIKQQLSSVKSLGAGSTDLTETLAWVQRSRSIDSKKAAAEARTKMLDSMDDEFGIDELVENEKFGKAQYSRNDLKDLTVLHDMNSFKEGQMTVLTLQDKEILDDDEEGDVLVNVNMIDDERVNKNNELKKKKPDYNPYTEDIDEFGNVKRQNMLSKYDEVIEGEKKRSFKLSEAESSELIRKKMAEGLQKRPGNVTLDTSHLKVTASEYFTTDEVAAFKKPRRKKIRKIRKTKVDEIAPLPNEEKLTGSKDHGSRSNRIRSTGGGIAERQIENSDNMEIDIDEKESTKTVKRGSGGKISERELYQVQLDDEDNELEAALARSRRRKLLEDRKSVLDNLVQRETKEESIPGVAKASAIVLDRTAEFAKGIGGNEEEKVSVAPPKPEPMETQEGAPTISDWKDVDFVTATFGEFQDYDPSRVETQEVIEAEPSLQRGLSGALQVAQRKGFIDTTKQSINSKDINDAVKATGSLRARFYQVDKDTGQDVDSRRRSDREYSSGVFPEKRNYNPDVKIAYTDSIGRELNSKEAFRQLSHKFHGKGSGKMKTEKRMKKAIEEMSLKKMDSDDTPLGSAALFREKQKDANSAYIVLSGGNRIPTDVNSSISKLSKR